MHELQDTKDSFTAVESGSTMDNLQMLVHLVFCILDWSHRRNQCIYTPFIASLSATCDTVITVQTEYSWASSLPFYFSGYFISSLFNMLSPETWSCCYKVALLFLNKMVSLINNNHHNQKRLFWGAHCGRWFSLGTAFEFFLITRITPAQWPKTGLGLSPSHWGWQAVEKEQLFAGRCRGCWCADPHSEGNMNCAWNCRTGTLLGNCCLTFTAFHS